MFEKYCQLRQLGCNNKISSNNCVCAIYLNCIHLCHIYILCGLFTLNQTKSGLKYIAIVTVISVPFSGFILTLDLQTIKVYFTTKTKSKQEKTLRLKCSIYFYIP